MASSTEKRDSQAGLDSHNNWSHDYSQEQTVKPPGVRKSEAAQKVIIGKHKICLIISIGLAAYMYSLDGTTTWTYLAFAGSALNDHSLIAIVQVAQSIIVACGKSFIAKLADTLSRPVAYCLVDGMFAILVPVTIIPLIVTLGRARHKAQSQGLVEPGPKNSATGILKVESIWDEVDMLGLLILSGGVTCVLLPLTLAKSAKGGWSNPSMIAMLTVGPILLIAFGLYEWKFAPYPIVPMKCLRNKAVVGAALIGFFDFVSFYLTFSYLYSFVFVVKGWELRHLNYFTSTQTVALTVFGIMAGIIMRTTHRYKSTLVVGLLIRLFGVGLMTHSRDAKANTGELVMTQ
ncbi:unnamed protein product, partial [Rhizoctonia solani]